MPFGLASESIISTELVTKGGYPVLFWLQVATAVLKNSLGYDIKRKGESRWKVAASI